MKLKANLRSSTSAAVVLASLAAGAAATAPAPARGDFVINMGTTYNGTDPVGTAPYLRATFKNTATPGKVRLTLENLLTANGGAQFVDSWLFNVNPAITSGVTFSYVSGVPTDPGVGTSPVFSPNAYGNNTGPGVSGLPQSGLFDIAFAFQTSGSSGASPVRFDGQAGSNTSVWDITGPASLNENSFNYLSVQDKPSNGEYLSVAHVQGIPASGGRTTSGALSGGVGVVPEPASVVLMGLGVGVSSLVVWRTRRKAAEGRTEGEASA